MIKNIDELIIFQYNEYLEIKDDRLLIEKSDCWKKSIRKLQDYGIKLPSSYLKIIENIDINKKIIGYFSISLSSHSDHDLIEEIIQTHEDPFFPKEFMDKHNMYQIGSYNTDLICITNGTNQYKEGEILFVVEEGDIYHPQDDQVKRLARDFEQFLILAGNLNQIHMQIEEDYSNEDKKRQEFFDRLRKLGVSEEYHDAWNYAF